MSDNPNKITRLWSELKRRKVVRVITVYAAAAFVILELASIVIEPLRLPDWTLAMIIVLLCIGFIIAVILSWIYDVTPEGIEKTRPAKITTEPSPESPSRVLGWKIATIISVIVIACLVAWNILKSKERPGNIQTLEKSIAVLPFDNRSGKEEDAYFTDGIHDQVISQLYKIGGLSVRGRTSVDVYRNSPKNLRTIGEELNANYLLEGGVQRAGEMVRINVQLIDARSDDHLWTEIYDRPLSTENLLSIQSEIALKIASEMKLILSPEEKTRIQARQTENLEAYNACLRGRFYMAKRTRKTIQTAQQYFLEAISLDSTYALAYAGLADSYVQLSGYGAVPTAEAYPLAKDAASRALALDPNLGEAWLSSAWVEFHLQKGHKDLHEEFEKAIDLAPGLANAYHWYAWYYFGWEQFDRAEMLIQKALEIDPLSILINTSAGQLSVYAGNVDQAIERLHSVLELDPTYPRANNALGQAYVLKDKFDLALDHIHRAVDYSDRNPQYIGTLAWALGRAGMNEEVESLINELNRQAEQNYVSAYDFATAYMGTGNFSKAMEYLQISVKENDAMLCWVTTDPRFVYVKDQPEFRRIIKLVWPETGE